MNKLLTNYNIAKYCAKYFFLLIFTSIYVNCAGSLCTARDTFTNVVGFTLYVGLFLACVLILKSDVTKLIKNLSDKSEN